MNWSNRLTKRPSVSLAVEGEDDSWREYLVSFGRALHSGDHLEDSLKLRRFAEIVFLSTVAAVVYRVAYFTNSQSESQVRTEIVYKDVPKYDTVFPFAAPDCLIPTFSGFVLSMRLFWAFLLLGSFRAVLACRIVCSRRAVARSC